MKTSRILRFLSTAVLVIGFSTAAHAQATRTWVSGVGDDANPCSRTAPCKTFAGAISKTAAGGEINVLDPGGFGAVTITKSIKIISDHILAGVLVSGTNGVIINAGVNDRVILEGLDFEGLGTGLNGIRILSGGPVYINRCSIRSFSGNGVSLESSTPNARVLIRDSFISFNGGGVNVHGNGQPNVASIIDTFVDGNTTFAAQADGAGNAVALVKSFLTGSPTGLSLLNGGAAISFGTSNVITGAGAVTSTNPFR